jgi:cellulose synthase operon protein C
MSAGAVAEQPPWLVRVRRTRDGRPAGAGMLCDERHVITCAHVVHSQPLAEPPSEPVYVEFQFLARHEPIAARVIEGGWHPEAGQTGDVAVLELELPLPDGALPAPLRSTRSGVIEHQLWAYGYPKAHPIDGISALVEIVGHAEAERWLQLQARSAYGQTLEPGFSGTPVWDRTVPGVIGIAVKRERDSDMRTAFAIPVETLARYWTPLAPRIRDTIVSDPEAERRRLQELLGLPLEPDGTLPAVRSVLPYEIGVTKSTHVTAQSPDPPYVRRRRVDEQLEAALERERFLLLIGDSTAGKSRTLFELLRRQMPDAALIVPDPGPASLRGLTRLALPLDAPAVLWLDDIDAYLGPNGIDVKVLQYFERHEPAITIAATITSRRYEEVLEADAMTKTARRVLDRACMVRLPTRLDGDDLESARAEYPREVVPDRGLGEQLVAAPLLERRFEAAREREPAGWAVIAAAADWGEGHQ